MNLCSEFEREICFTGKLEVYVNTNETTLVHTVQLLSCYLLAPSDMFSKSQECVTC